MTRGRVSALLVTALGTWLGIHAVRLCLAMIVWNVAEDDTAAAGYWAIGIWVAGIAGALLARRVLGDRAARWLGALFAILVVLRQAFPGEYTSPAFAFAAWITWLAWLPAFVTLLARARRLDVVAAGIVLGTALQVAGQTALHGLDLFVLVDTAALVAALALAAAFVGALWRVDASAASESGAPGGAWGALAVGPFLFVELTLLANPGRLETLTGLAPAQVAAALALGLVAALAALAFVRLGARARMALGVIAVLALVPGRGLGPLAIVVLSLAQVALAASLAAAFERGGRRVHLFAAIGAIAFFVLLFAFYSFRDRVDLAWPVAAAIVVLAGASRGAPAVSEGRRALAAGAVALAGALAFAAQPSPPEHGLVLRDQVRVLTYNVHEGLDFWSVPSPVALADVIGVSDTEIVALQEVNRGWNIAGGVDLLAWLRWRFPGYQVAYGGMDTALLGNAILSRYPIVESGVGVLPRGKSALPRGYVWARVESLYGPLLVASAHFVAYDGFTDDRTAQAEALVGFWAGQPRTILAGDYNSHPEDPAIARIRAAGLVDAAAAQGLGATPTYASGRPYERIDYVFVSRDLEPAAARIPATTASDHSPVLVTLRVR